MPMTREVFVSYSEPDRDCAFELVERVESQGILCWIAPRDISPSSDWAAEIIDAINAARVMVLVYSASSNNSPQVRREVERAVHKQLNILPFRIADVLPSKSLEYFLSAQHWLDAFPPPREPYYRSLCAHLRSILAAPVAAPDVHTTPLRASPVAREAAAAIDPAVLAQVESELAVFVGPVAKHLVRRAAPAVRDVEQLVVRLAGEIDSDNDRRRFAAACRRFTTHSR
jgi:hypothetical protein